MVYQNTRQKRSYNEWKRFTCASEIAYYSNLPRIKIYPTLKKLEKKKLSIISQQKPLICSAIPPQEAFGEIVELHERRSKNMKKIVDILQRINDEVQKPYRL